LVSYEAFSGVRDYSVWPRLVSRHRPGVPARFRETSGSVVQA